MGKKKKKNIITPAINENETAAHSKSNTSEVKTTGKKFKDNNRSTDDIQAEVHFPRNVTKENKGKDSHEYIDITAPEQSSCTLQSEIIDADLKLCIRAIIGCMKIAKCLSKVPNLNNFSKNPYLKENRDRLDLFQQDLDRLLYSKDPKVIEDVKNYFSSNITKLKEHELSPKETELIIIEAENYSESIIQYHEKEEVTKTTAELEDGPNEKILNMEKNEMKKDRDDSDGSADVIQEPSRYLRTAEGKKGEIFCNRITDDIQAARQYLPVRNMRYGEETLVKIADESTGKGKDTTARSNVDIQIPRNCPKNIICDVEESISKWDSFSEVKHANLLSKTISTEETDKLAHEFGLDLREFSAFQNSKLDEQLKKCGGVKSELEVSKEKLDSLSSEKENVTAVAGVFDETRITMETEVEATTEVATDAESDETGEAIIQLKDEKIFFQFVNDTRFITTDTFSSYEKNNTIFHFKDKEIQVCFIGSQLFISTRNNEFDFHIRKRQHIELNDETTQTDALP